MNKEQVMEKLNEIFRDLFDDEELVLTEETTAKDVEDWDSLAHLQMITTVEKEFQIKFSLGEINNFANVGDLCNCVQKHVGE